MIKYRTVERNGKFYPQKRLYLFFWCDYEQSINNCYPHVMMTVVKKSLKESEDFISQQILKDKYAEAERKTTKIHNFTN